MIYSLEAITQLDHSKEFARLHQKFHQFNPLKVLRVDQYEIRHSNVLAWLLDPNKNHQLGSFFVKKLLSRLVMSSEIDRLEKLGISFSGQSKLFTAKYTRLFSKSKVIASWDDDEVVVQEMEELFHDHKNQAILNMIETLKENPKVLEID